MTPRRTHLLLALALFALEVVIATRLVHLSFIRYSLGDFLVVGLVYFAAQALRPMRPLPLAVGVFLFACAVETSQYFHLANLLHAPKGSVLRIVLGDSFSFEDIGMYFLGTVTFWALDAWGIQKRVSPGSRS